MSDLIAVTFPDLQTAQRARQAFNQLANEYALELEDGVVAYKDEAGHLRLDQTVNLMAAGATSGGFWGLLVGVLFSLPAAPAAGLLLPAMSTAIGAGLGALGGKLSDYGINDAMMRSLASDIQCDKAALFILARDITLDRLLERMAAYDGEVLRTSFPRELERELRAILTKQAA